ncbi:MAG TPA: hypothetical protein VIQ53_09925, partial [Inquilinus sp.]
MVRNIRALLSISCVFVDADDKTKGLSPARHDRTGILAMMSRLRIRPARPQDRDALGALKLRASLAWGDHVDELQALPEARQVPAGHMPAAIVAELDGAIVGFATVLPR